MNQEITITNKIERYLITLSKYYKKNSEELLERIIVHSRVETKQNWSMFNGEYGHLVYLYLDEDLYVDIINDIDNISQKIRDDLNKNFHIAPDEFIENVIIEMKELSINQNTIKEIIESKKSPILNDIEPEVINRIWKNDYFRIFLSHKTERKKETYDLKKSLEKYGFSCFVAHSDIEPSKEWQIEIENALFSMNALIPLICENFHSSNWTDQEIGVAIGRNTPLIHVKFSDKPPLGFINKYQALSGDWDKLEIVASNIFNLLMKNPDIKSDIINSAISKFSKSGNYDETKFIIKNILSNIDQLNTSQEKNIISAYSSNTQIHRSYYAQENITCILNRITGKKYEIEGTTLKPLDNNITT
jgi:hypothetical protein